MNKTFYFQTETIEAPWVILLRPEVWNLKNESSSSSAKSFIPIKYPTKATMQNNNNSNSNVTNNNNDNDGSNNSGNNNNENDAFYSGGIFVYLYIYFYLYFYFYLYTYFIESSF